MYEYADKICKTLQKKYIDLFDKILLPMDELSVARRKKSRKSDTDSLTANVAKAFKKISALVIHYFLMIAVRAYKKGWTAAQEVVGKKDEGEKKIPDEQWLLEYLNAPDRVLKYAFLPEVERKKARTAEALSVANTRMEQQAELKKHLRYISTQTVWGTINVTDKAIMKSYEDAGVKQVRWITQQDEKVCAICRKLNGHIFDIGNVPDKPHPNCRCLLVPYKGGKRS